jgi:outer membrane protein assembly factor BamA
LDVQGRILRGGGGTVVVVLLALSWLVAVPSWAQQSTAFSSSRASSSPEPPSRAPLGVTESSVATAPPLELLSGINKYVGLRVGEVQIQGVGDDARQQQYLRELIVQPLHEPLDRLKLRQSLHALYATGRFTDLQIQVDRGPADELALVFVVRPNFFIGSVTVGGLPKHPTEHQLVSASKLQLGELYTTEKVEDALHSMQSVLEDNGLHQAEITYQEEFLPDTQQVNVHFRVTPGAPARVGQVTVRGESGLSTEEFEHIAGLHTGNPMNAQKATKALQRVRKRYQKERRLEAQVAIADKQYRPPENSLDYIFQLDRGPIVDIRVEGARISGRQLRRFVPVYEEGTVDDDLLNEGLRNLRDYLQMHGFFDARVSWQRELDPERNQLNVVYRVDPGIRHRLVAVHIEGNKAFATDLIRERMQVKPVSNLLNRGWYSESILDHDIKVIEQTLYQANGFLHVKIGRIVNDDYLGVIGHMLVTLRIEEGPQTRVGSVKLTGNRFFTPEDLQAGLRAQGEGLVTVPGQPFSEANVAQDRRALMGLYFNNGFPEIQVETSSTPAQDDPNRMDVAFTVSEGSRVFVDRVLVSGLNYTRPYVVRRQLQASPGAPLDQLGLLDSQRSLYDLGLFNEVQMAVQNPEGKAPYKNVLFQLSEAQRWTFKYGLGFEVQTGGQPANVVNTAPAPGVHPPKDTVPKGPAGTNPQSGTTASPSVNLELSRINFRGRDDTVSLKTHLSNLQKRASVGYAAPHWFDRPDLRLSFTALYDNSRDVRTFASERLEGAAQLQRVISRRGDGEPITTLLFRYSYRRVKVDPSTLAISTPLIPLLSQPVLLGMPSVSFIRDRRDNVLNAGRGSYTTVDFAVSAKAFGSGSVTSSVQQLSSGGTTPATTAANFTRLVMQNSSYTPLWHDPHTTGKHSLVFARTTRVGIENVLGATANVATVPLPERLFGGGADSIRGFALNQAGPRDLTTGFPLGGNASFFNSFELRLPPPTLPFVGDNLNFVIFHDAGNVFQTGTEMFQSFSRWRQPNRSACVNESTYQQCRFDYMSQSLGAGLRYRTPIGPVRVDASYNLSPPSFPYFVQCPATHYSGESPPCSTLPVNSPYPSAFQYGTLRHFNFFFSIGQSF